LDISTIDNFEFVCDSEIVIWFLFCCVNIRKRRKTMLTAQEIIKLLGLEPHPAEGGHFRETYRSTETLQAEVLPSVYPSERAFSTAIYYLLTPQTCSRLHRLRTVEIFHFYLGDPLEMVLLYPDGHVREIVMGTDLAAGQQVQTVVPAEVWQGARLKPGGRFVLLGTTMSPGFDFRDYETGHRAALLADYPHQKAWIETLTPE
jgi:uncharacterized protein